MCVCVVVTHAGQQMGVRHVERLGEEACPEPTENEYLHGEDRELLMEPMQAVGRSKCAVCHGNSPNKMSKILQTRPDGERQDRADVLRLVLRFEHAFMRLCV